MNAQRIEELLQAIVSGNQPDLTLICEDGTVSAHSFMLTARSQVFRALLKGSFKESGSKEVDMTLYRKEAVEIFVDYINTARYKVEQTSCSLLSQLYQLGDYYRIESFLEVVETDVKSLLSTRNKHRLDNISEILAENFPEHIHTLAQEAQKIVPSTKATRLIIPQSVMDGLMRYHYQTRN